MTAIRKYLWMASGVLLIFTLLNVLSAPARADLPPRPMPTPVPVSKSTTLRGAHIVLQTQPDVWSVVQWQDVNGDWHDVDGWRGSATNGTVEWWMAQKDFGTGPFRWTVYQSDGGEIVAASESFYLPASANETLVIVMP